MNLSHMYPSGGILQWTRNDESMAIDFGNISTAKVQGKPGFSFLKGFQRFCYYDDSIISKIRDQVEDEEIWKENNGSYLRNYIQYYFARLLEEGKVMTLRDNSTHQVSALMWCIGLTDRNDRTPLYAIAMRTNQMDQAAVCQSTDQQSPFRLITTTTKNNKPLFNGNYLRSGKDSIKYASVKLQPLPLAHHLPLAAQFLFDRVHRDLVPGQLLMFDAFGIYDPSTAIDITHVFPDSDSTEYESRKSRIPEKYHHLSDSVLIKRLRDGLTHAVEMAILNPRLGVPQFFNHSVQLLLPISLDEDVTNAFVPDVVLALSWNRHQRGYVVETMLTVGMAKGNARLVQRLDQDWLKKTTDEAHMALGAEMVAMQMQYQPLSDTGFAPPGLGSSGASSSVGGFSSGLLGPGNSSAGIMASYEHGMWSGSGGLSSLDILDDSHQSGIPPGMGSVVSPAYNGFGGGNHFPIGTPGGNPSGHIGSPIGSQLGGSNHMGMFPPSSTHTSSDSIPSPKSAAPATAMSAPSNAVSHNALPSNGSFDDGMNGSSIGVGSSGAGQGGAAWTGASSVAIVNAGGAAPPGHSQARSPSPPAVSESVSHAAPSQSVQSVHSQTKSAQQQSASPSSASEAKPAAAGSSTATAAGAKPSYGNAIGLTKRNLAWEGVDWVCPQFGKDCGFGPTKCTHGPIKNGNNGWDSVDWTCPKFGKGCKFGPEKCSHK